MGCSLQEKTPLAAPVLYEWRPALNDPALPYRGRTSQTIFPSKVFMKYNATRHVFAQTSHTASLVVFPKEMWRTCLRHTRVLSTTVLTPPPRLFYPRLLVGAAFPYFKFPKGDSRSPSKDASGFVSSPMYGGTVHRVRRRGARIGARGPSLSVQK